MLGFYFLEEVSPGSEGEENIQNIIRNAKFDPEFTFDKWKPYRIELIKNKLLEDEYDEKRQDMLIRGRKGLELAEEYGFSAHSTDGVAAVVSAGLNTREDEYNPLGYSRLGVYLCRHPDVCLQHALLQQAQAQVIRLIVCKYIKGRSTTAVPRPATSAGFIEPTQGYDGHTSALQPSLSDPLQTQYDRAQIYLYEINKLLQPSMRPRQVLPLALVTLTEGGTYVPAVDTKLVFSKEKPALLNIGANVNVGNPRLAQIINAINARSGGSGSESKETGLLGTPGELQLPGPTSPDGLAAATRGLGVLVGPGRLSPGEVGPPSPKLGLGNQHINLAQKLGGGAGIPLLEQALVSNGLLNGQIPGMPRDGGIKGGLLETAPRMLAMQGNINKVNGELGMKNNIQFPMEGDGNPQLQMIISKINARLQTDPKPPATTTTVTSSSSRPSPSQGDGLLPLPVNSAATNGNLITLNGNTGNTHGSGSSSLGSRPGSADSMLSGTGHGPIVSQGTNTTPKIPAHLLAASSGGLANQGIGLLAPENMNGESLQSTKVSGQHFAHMATGLPVSMSMTQGIRTNQNAMAAGLLTRKDNLCIDYGQMIAAASLAGPGLYQGIQGQPLYSDRLGHPQPTHTPTLPAPNPTLHALHSPYQLLGLNMGLGPALATPNQLTAAATNPHLNSLHQSTLAFRPLSTPLKRAFPEASSTLEWDKRPKFF